MIFKQNRSPVNGVKTADTTTKTTGRKKKPRFKNEEGKKIYILKIIGLFKVLLGTSICNILYIFFYKHNDNILY